MLLIFEFLVNFIIDFIMKFNIPLFVYKGIEITYLNFMLACALIPIILNMFKVSFLEIDRRDIGFGGIVGTTKNIAIKNFSSSKSRSK